jgi:hypothetical protein
MDGILGTHSVGLLRGGQMPGGCREAEDRHIAVKGLVCAAIPGRTPSQPSHQAGPGPARYCLPAPPVRGPGAGTAPLPRLAGGGTSSRSAGAHHRQTPPRHESGG